MWDYLQDAGKRSKTDSSGALDATDEVVEKAVQEAGHLLITHHPLIFSAMKSVTDGLYWTQSAEIDSK